MQTVYSSILIIARSFRFVENKTQNQLTQDSV